MSLNVCINRCFGTNWIKNKCVTNHSTIIYHISYCYPVFVLITRSRWLHATPAIIIHKQVSTWDSFTAIGWDRAWRCWRWGYNTMARVWASCMIRKITGCACAGNAGNVFPATPVTHVRWCMPGSLTSGFLWSWWRGKRSRHSRRMRNPQCHLSGKRPMAHYHWEDIVISWNTNWSIMLLTCVDFEQF